MEESVIDANAVLNVDGLDASKSGKVVQDANDRNVRGIWKNCTILDLKLFPHKCTKKLCSMNLRNYYNLHPPFHVFVSISCLANTLFFYLF